MEGARLLLKIPGPERLELVGRFLSQEIGLEELPKVLGELLAEEAGPEDVKAFLEFVLTSLKALREKGRDSLVADLVRLGFGESEAAELADALKAAIPTPERDAALLKELGREELARLAEGWVSLRLGDYEDTDELAEALGLPRRTVLAAERFLNALLDEVLSGELSVRRLPEVLSERYGLGREEASVLAEVVGDNLEALFRVAVYRLLKELKEKE
ncbi:hypothetical protein DRO33_05380 [Candidatus Bathyarchaeota archaeon]|nr:MAG: hypothetical protein DRO33_05380 [Candidatus Bathyarchaeota archaeon]